MSINQQFLQYLSQKKKKQSYIDECAGFVDKLTAVIGTKHVESEEIIIFIKNISPWWGGQVIVKTAFQFLDDYVKFIESEQPQITERINKGCLQIFLQTAKNEIRKRKQDILPIPADVKINPSHLTEMTNQQFIAALKDLQQLVIDCYDNIDLDPFAWGYPNFYTTEGYYNRVNNILFALVFCGEYNSGVLTVDKAKFFNRNDVKRHKNVELMFLGFERMGFSFDFLDSKSNIFTVSYKKNPHIIAALHAYASEIDENTPDWKYLVARNGFSYRFVEDPAVQRHEKEFLAEMDYASETLREIQLWLHAEAAKCGFFIDPSEPLEKGCLLYKKGSKQWLLVGQLKDGNVFCKAIFRNVLTNEKMAALYCKFPDTFKSNCGYACGPNVKQICNMRIEFAIDGKLHRCCAYGSFVFKNPTLDDIKLILELFKLENKIK